MKVAKTHCKLEHKGKISSRFKVKEREREMRQAFVCEK